VINNAVIDSPWTNGGDTPSTLAGKPIKWVDVTELYNAICPALTACCGTCQPLSLPNTPPTNITPNYINYLRNDLTALLTAYNEDNLNPYIPSPSTWTYNSTGLKAGQVIHAADITDLRYLFDNNPSWDCTPDSLQVKILGSGTGSVGGSTAGNVCASGGFIACGNGGTTCKVSYDYGAQVTLKAYPKLDGSTFAGWGDACSAFGTADSCLVTVTGPTIVKATFNPPCTCGNWSSLPAGPTPATSTILAPVRLRIARRRVRPRHAGPGRFAPAAPAWRRPR